VDLDVVFLPAGLVNLAGRTAVVIDVLRATTTIVTALGHGCAGMLPVELPEEAIDLVKKLGRDSHLIGGERKGLKMEGFDLGNSPSEYDRAAVAGRKVVFCTTNGTAAIRRTAAAQARPVYLAALVNAPAVAAHLLREGASATLVCAGREEAFALEDALCAGLIASDVLRQRQWTGTDGARAAAALWEKLGRVKTSVTLAATDHGRYLASIGLGEDVAHAAQVGIDTLIPVLREGCLVPLECETGS